MDFSNALADYGMAGIFILYLIYDRQVIIKSLQKSIEANTTITERLSVLLENKTIERNKK